MFVQYILTAEEDIDPPRLSPAPPHHYRSEKLSQHSYEYENTS